MCRTQTSGQLLFEDCNVSECTIVGSSRALARNIGSGDDMNLMVQVIESQEAIEEHQHTIRQSKIILGLLANFLQLADGVIGKITDSAGGKWRQARNRRRTMPPEQLFQHGQHVALAMFASLSALQHYIVASRSHLKVGTRSEKCVACDLLAALNRFQQKSVRFVGRYGEKSRNGRQQVS